MKRDWDVIRMVLVALEEKPDRKPMGPEEIPAFDAELVAYNMNLLLQAGLIEGRTMSAIGMGYGPAPIAALALSWRGHELLDAIRQDSTWNKVKQVAKEKGLDLTFDIVAGLAKAFIKTQLGLPL